MYISFALLSLENAAIIFMVLFVVVFSNEHICGGDIEVIIYHLLYKTGSIYTYNDIKDEQLRRCYCM